MAFTDQTRAAQLLDRLIETDFTRRRPVFLLVALFLMVRLPWLWTGYGAETDAYRVALSALHLFRDGEYLPSRLPGYPVHEFLMAPLVQIAGSVATNAATALAALVGMLLLARITQAIKYPQPGIVVIAFAFTPFLLVNSVETKDYLWALSFLLASYLAAIKDRPVVAGVLLGLGAGCRITTAAFALPLCLLYLDRRAVRAGAGFLVSLAVVALLVFLPVTLQYGMHFWNYADSRISADIVVRSIGQYSIGAFGSLSLLAALALSWRGVARLPRLASTDVHVRIWIVAVLLYGLAFLRLPIDIAYLIPIYPFCFLLLARLINPRLLAAVIAAIIFSGFIDLDISAMHNLNLRTFVRTARPCFSCAEFAHDWHVRKLYRHYAATLATTQLPEHSIVLTGGVFPDFAVIAWNRFNYRVIDRDRDAVSMLSDDGAMVDTFHDVIYLASPRRPEVLQGLRGQGYRVLKADPTVPNWDVRLSPD
ncbi:MAG: glycosyltransferase 87 family protein [Dehalococcoidia bacterium]